MVLHQPKKIPKTYRLNSCWHLTTKALPYTCDDLSKNFTVNLDAEMTYLSECHICCLSLKEVITEIDCILHVWACESMIDYL